MVDLDKLVKIYGNRDDWTIHFSGSLGFANPEEIGKRIETPDPTKGYLFITDGTVYTEDDALIISRADLGESCRYLEQGPYTAATFLFPASYGIMPPSSITPGALFRFTIEITRIPGPKGIARVLQESMYRSFMSRLQEYSPLGDPVP